MYAAPYFYKIKKGVIKMGKYVSTVIDIALNEVGYLEKKSNKDLDDKTANAGSANYTKYGRDMHELYPEVMDFPAAWCDAFVDWCFQKAYGVSNAKGLLGGNFNDYTPSSAQLYKNKGAWYETPEVGDQIFFTNGARICHTGLVYKVTKTKVYTIEGNTTGASELISNGGGVCKKSYALNYSKIAGYGRPKYDPEPSFKKTSGTATASKATEEKKATESANSFKASIAGTYKVTAEMLNVRNGAGNKHSIMVAIPKGTAVNNYGYFTTAAGTKWLYVQFTYKGVKYTGFCSSAYLKK